MSVSFTCALALFISSLVKQVKFSAGMEGAFIFATIQLVFAGFPTTNTCKIKLVNMLSTVDIYIESLTNTSRNFLSSLIKEKTN